MGYLFLHSFVLHNEKTPAKLDWQPCGRVRSACGMLPLMFDFVNFCGHFGL